MSGNTLNLGLPYPSGPDANDVPYWNQALAEAVDVAVGSAWVQYTPAFANLTVGNGTLAARYIKIGRTITCVGYIVFGSTTSVSNSVVMTLPRVATGIWSGYVPYGPVALSDASSGALEFGNSLAWSGTEVIFRRNANGAAVGPTIPWTWAVGDVIGWQITYETIA